MENAFSEYERLYLEMRMLYEGNRYTEIIEKYTPAAEQGNAFAQYMLGRCYAMLDGKENLEAGRTWDKKAAESLKIAAAQGSIRANYLLGECYLWRRGVEMSNSEATKWFARAVKGYTPLAEQDDSEAQFMLGCCYYWGRGIKRDDDKAFALFKRAALQGHPLGEYQLARCYMFGNGVWVDDCRRTYWLFKAAAHGIVDAMDWLGYYSFYGRAGNEPDYQDAVIWLEKAVEHGSTQSNTLEFLGICYGWALGTERNVPKAIEYLEILCTRDYRSAKDLLEELGAEGFQEAYDAIERSWEEVY